MRGVGLDGGVGLYEWDGRSLTRNEKQKRRMNIELSSC